MELEAAGYTDKGRVREENEDAILVDLELGLFVVADGCGGHAAGEVASRHVVTTLSERAGSLRRDPAPKDAAERQALLDQLGEAIREAGAVIYEHSQTEPQMAGMATTATALLLQGDHGYIAHIGDTRLYCLRKDRLSQLTEDHTLAAEMLRRGLMQPLDIKTWAYRNTLQRALGHNQRGQVDMVTFDLQPADVLLLCSDGLHGLLEDDEIHRQLAQAEQHSPLAIAEQLIGLANERGGADNISAVVVKVRGAVPPTQTVGYEELAEALRGVELCRDLSFQELVKIQRMIEIRDYEVGEYVYREGEAGDGMYIVARGSVAVTQSTMLLCTVPAGGIFGHLALLDAHPRTTTAQAQAPLRVLLLSAEPFALLMRDDPVLGMKLLFRLAQQFACRIRELNQQLTDAAKAML